VIFITDFIPFEFYFAGNSINMTSLKGKRIYSILLHKCPRCHEGDLYNGSAYAKNFSSMPETCDHCGLRYEQEPSFFSGAMYVSYALQVALFTTVYVALRVLFDPRMEVYMVVTILSSIALLPVTLRLSRAIYINFFIGFQKNRSNKNLPNTQQL
jgi:uncharacterized protein (DUF983 family)